VEIGNVDLGIERKDNSSAAIFIAGVIVGGVGGGLAGWLLGGHLAPILSGILNLLGRDTERKSVRFDAFQQ
jgi:hypothetical protein